jgi:hypothetical protein
LSHTWETPGDYNISALLELAGGQQATKTRTITVGEPNSGGGSPPTRSNSGDEIDLSTVTFLHSNVTNWKVTSTITRVSIGLQQICMFHTAAGSWPAPNGTYGNPWVLANIGGRWYAGTFEWMRPGQVCKDLDPGAGGATIANRIGPHVKVQPLQGWVPKKGELVGFMYSGWARDGRRSVEERSNVVLVTWPY